MCPKIPIEPNGGAKPEENDAPVTDTGADGKSAASPEQEVFSDNSQEVSSSAPCGQEQDKASDYLDMLQRMKAEFDNYRRRTQKEKADTIRYATEDILKKIIPVLDNLQRGVEFARKGGMDTEILKGIELVEKQIVDLLAEYGAEAFESMNQPFDPNMHEPMYVMDSEEVEENTVIQEALRGYKMHDKILRVAQVVVSKKPSV